MYNNKIKSTCQVKWTKQNSSSLVQAESSWLLSLLDDESAAICKLHNFILSSGSGSKRMLSVAEGQYKPAKEFQYIAFVLFPTSVLEKSTLWNAYAFVYHETISTGTSTDSLITKRIALQAMTIDLTNIVEIAVNIHCIRVL